MKDITTLAMKVIDAYYNQCEHDYDFKPDVELSEAINDMENHLISVVKKTRRWIKQQRPHIDIEK